MSRKNLVSVIVPVYNTDKYLRRCVDSILSQSYPDIEVILVDDGSTDKCAEICDQFAASDSRVVVIHKENAGVSSARNVGLSIAGGEYICFVDSDDFLPQDAVMSLHNEAVRSNSPYVVGMCKIIGKDSVKNSIEKLHFITIQNSPEELLSYVIENGSYSPYAKLFKVDIILNNNLRFKEDMRIAEDAVFIRTFLQFCDSVSLIPQVVYEYNAGNTQSLSKKAYPEYCRLYGEKMKALSALVNQLPLDRKRKEEFLAERGINGVRISVNHYFSHWKNKEQLIRFLEDICEELLPWVSLECEDSLVERDSWWRHYHVSFRNKDYERIYRSVAAKMQMRNIKRIIGRFARSIKNCITRS